MNKIIRTAYGNQSEYSQLTVDALREWNTWNEEISTGQIVPLGMTTTDRVFLNNGHLTLSDEGELPEFERQSAVNTTHLGQIPIQLMTSDKQHQAIAAENGWTFGMDPFRRSRRGLNNNGLLDTVGGTALADKACRFAMHKAQVLGVHFVLDAEAGCLESLVYARRKTIGIRTSDCKTHPASLIILACGGWTPTLLPQLDYLCEATAGSVALMKIPKSSILYERFAPNNFPSWTFNMRHGAEGGLYGFARDDDGWLKFGYRGTKYTNPVIQADGLERSTPKTRWTKDKITTVPDQALRVIRGFLAENMPELGREGIDISFTRVCWYTDTFDNHFVIDYVPELGDSLMVATGGSGHAFKYLPNIGHYVVDVMEGQDDQSPLIKLWKWRESNENNVNTLMEGSQSTTALQNVAMADSSFITSKAKL